MRRVKWLILLLFKLLRSEVLFLNYCMKRLFGFCIDNMDMYMRFLNFLLGRFNFYLKYYFVRGVMLMNYVVNLMLFLVFLNLMKKFLLIFDLVLYDDLFLSLLRFVLMLKLNVFFMLVLKLLNVFLLLVKLFLFQKCLLKLGWLFFCFML